MKWCVESDAFSFDVRLKARLPTPRGILSLASGVFDPLGFLASFVLFTKEVMQSPYQIELAWDNEIPPEFRSTILDKSVGKVASL